MPTTDRIHAVVLRGEDHRASGVLSFLGAYLVPGHPGLGLSGDSLHRHHLHAEVTHDHPQPETVQNAKHEENVNICSVPHCVGCVCV